MNGERQGFASLKDLFAFLKAQADGAAGQAFEMGDEEGGEFDLKKVDEQSAA